MHELSIAEAVVRDRAAARRRAAGDARRGEGRAPAPGRARRAGVRLRARGGGHARPRARSCVIEDGAGRGPLPRVRRGGGAAAASRCAARAAAGCDVEVLRGEELLVDALELEDEG